MSKCKPSAFQFCYKTDEGRNCTLRGISSAHTDIYAAYASAIGSDVTRPAVWAETGECSGVASTWRRLDQYRQPCKL